MYIDMDEKSILNLDNVIWEFKKLLDSFIEKFSNSNLKNHYSTETLVNKYFSDEEFLKKLGVINGLMDDISNKLEALDYFENEFHNFLSIQNMIRYIMGNIEKYILFSSFIKRLTSSFCELINTKIKLIKNGEYEKYNGIYKSFDDYLFNQEEFFYLNIYEPTHQYDDLIREVNNILW